MLMLSQEMHASVIFSNVCFVHRIFLMLSQVANDACSILVNLLQLNTQARVSHVTCDT